MEYSLLFIFLFIGITYVHTQEFKEESPYMLVRFMDLKSHEWKPSMLDEMEKALDAELKYKDEKKGIRCQSIDFEQEAGYPKQYDRFLDLSIRGLCTDDEGKVHNIDKDIIIVAIERNVPAVNHVTGGSVFKVGNVQLFKRDRNKLNLIIIPIAVGFVLFLLILTFVLRRLRYAQKRRHILAELQKKKSTSVIKGQTIANVDPHASEKQRLIQLDPTVVGNASDTMGSPKEFTNEQYASSTRNNPPAGRDYQGGPPPVPSKDNRAPYYRDDETSFQNQRSMRSSRERVHVPYENESRYPYDSQQHDMIPMQEQQPRVVVRTVRDDGNQPFGESTASSFVPIPVQVERSGPHQRNIPPYHSDPYYRHGNS